jgi:hypothetical protein
MTTRTLYADGVSGTMLIGLAGINIASAISDPIGNRQSLFFHSRLPYIQIRQKISTGTLTFPAQARGLITWDSGGKGCGGLC